MKNTKRIYKLICFIMIFSLVFSIIKPVLAGNYYYFEPYFDLDITNVVEPVIGAKPNYTNNMDCHSQRGNEFKDFGFVYWFEFDEDYEDVLDGIHEIYNFDDMYECFEYASKYSYNTQADFWDDGHFSIPKLTKFSLNKTYMAVFIGNFEDIPDLSPKREVREIYYWGDPYLAALVNDSADNVRAIYEENHQSKDANGDEINPENRYLAVMAIYEAKVPTQDYKATVKWNNAEGKTPDSFVLKLMNGTTVVKEQVITKENAVKDGVWEYDFGEYPTIDEDGNEITYTLAYSEGKAGDLKLFNTTVNGFTIDNTYVEPEISSKVKMRSLVDRETNNVKYKIDYNASIKKYSGNADVVLTTTLPFAIDEEKSNLDEGTYDATTRSIKWNHTIEDIDNTYDYSTSKNLDLYATAVLPYSIEATTVGEVTLSDAEGFSESVDTVDTVESGTGNPKTGDVNLQKYLSIGLIGLAAILMVVSIRRKYSTKKSKVQF